MFAIVSRVTTRPTLRRLHLAIAIATAIAATAITAGCGEREEPDPGSLPPPPDAQTGFEIIGSWTGELHQKGLKPFPVSATISSLDDPKKNRVTYSEIDCSGHWTFLGRNANAFTFREVIDSGASKECKGSGTVRLTPAPDGRLDYVFRGGGVTSRGVLVRTG